MDLKNKVAVVTGSSSGIGEAIALALAKEGVKVVVNSRHNIKGGQDVVRKIIKLEGEAIYVQADLSKEIDAKRLFKESIAKYKTVDILINNAGDAMPGKISDIENWRYVFDNILFNAVLATSEFIKIKSHEQRKIINISSIYGSLVGGNYNFIAYSSAKAAMNSLSVNLAKSLGKNVQVNSVAPGWVRTPAWGVISEDTEESVSDRTKIGRFIESKEIAETVVYLLKNDAITGQIVTVDGGATLKDMF